MNTREARQAVKAVMQAVEEPSRVPGATIKRIDFGPNGSVTRGEVVSFAYRTYGGVPAWGWTVRERGQFGRRTYYVWWLAEAEHTAEKWQPGTLTAHTVTGNADKGTYQELSQTHAIEIEGLELS